jgi:hypothetical protein
VGSDTGRSGREHAWKLVFTRWQRFAVVHAALLGLSLGLSFLLPGVRRDIDAYANGARIFWSMVLLWGLAWPWVMTAIHRPFARRALERILHEELVSGSGSRAT